MLYHEGDRRQYAIDDSLAALTKIIEHHVQSILDVGDLSRYRVALLLHESTELRSFIGERLDGFLHLWETDFTCGHKCAHLVLGDSELLCKLFHKGNTPAHELAQVLSVQATLCHGSAIEINKIVEWDRESCCDVTKSYQSLVHLLGFRSVG